MLATLCLVVVAGCSRSGSSHGGAGTLGDGGGATLAAAGVSDRGRLLVGRRVPRRHTPLRALRWRRLVRVAGGRSGLRHRCRSGVSAVRAARCARRSRGLQERHPAHRRGVHLRVRARVEDCRRCARADARPRQRYVLPGRRRPDHRRRRQLRAVHALRDVPPRDAAAGHRHPPVPPRAPPGDAQLSIDFGRAVSPVYVQILGLCDFNLPTPPPSSEE